MQNAIKTLIVDDEEVAADLLETLLAKLGIGSVETIYSGIEAEEKFKQCLDSGFPYGLVFLDILMPGTDGRAILKRLREAENNAGIKASDRAKIIMTTALTSTDAMVEAIFDGDCNEYLVKPVSPEYLKEILTKNGLL